MPEGEELEEAFIREIVPKINGLTLTIHPDKRFNPMSIDLYNPITGLVADLKTQNTPFFTAVSGPFVSPYNNESYDPTYTVTFNRKDYERYQDLYPDAYIYWCVNWQQLQWKNLTVDPLEGVWEVPFKDLATSIENETVYLADEDSYSIIAMWNWERRNYFIK